MIPGVARHHSGFAGSGAAMIGDLHSLCARKSTVHRHTHALVLVLSLGFVGAGEFVVAGSSNDSREVALVFLDAVVADTSNLSFGNMDLGLSHADTQKRG